MATFSNIGGAEPSTVTFKVRTVALDLGSTTEQAEILVLGDPESTLAVARVLGAQPVSTTFGLVTRPFLNTSTAAPGASDTGVIVRVAGPATIQGNSTVVQGTSPWVCAISSPVSSAAPATGDSGVVVRVVDYSTIVSVANTVTVGGTISVVGPISSAAPAAGSSGVVVHVVGYSTIVSIANTPAVTATITAPLSTSTPAHGSSAVLVRQVVSSLQSATVVITSSHSTALYDILSSAAASRKVFAFSLTSTAAVPSTFLFMSASTNQHWGVGFGSGSSGVTGANLSVSPPGALWVVPAGEALQAVIQAGSTGQGARVSVSWFE